MAVRDWLTLTAVVLFAPPLVFTAAVLLDHLIHGTTRRKRGRGQ